MSDNDAYQPIPCEVYDSYELAIMHSQQLQLVWRDKDRRHHISKLTPCDLQTQKGEEFLIANDEAGRTIRIRLDYIESCTPVVE
jgi:transcriptional antiterminator Rof (Rho-off)